MSNADMAQSDGVGKVERTVPPGRGLSTKLLLITIACVLLVEILIFLPSVANFRLRWLDDRLHTAAAMSTLLMEVEPDNLPQDVQDDVLKSIGVKAIAMRDGEASRLLASTRMPRDVDEHVDLANTGQFAAIRAAVATLFADRFHVLRVFGPVGESNRGYEIVMTDRALRNAMLTYARNVAGVSLLITLITAGLVYALIDRMMIRPIRSMTRSMLRFAEEPDDPARIIRPAPRYDEIGVAERELSAMQERLQKVLGEQKHLADLGLAVSKINHDMRNILASAQLMSDRLRQVRDPGVQAFAPKLLRALDRAVSYSEGVLAYGRTQEAPPSRRRVRLRRLVDEVHELLGVPVGSDIDFVNEIDQGFEIDADSEQLFRILTNLCRNAVEAMVADRDSAVVRRLTLSAERHGSVSRVLVEDTGPGLPQKARQNLFTAFKGSARSGGTGLGLAVAHELVRAHGGTLELVESVGGRTVFAVTIPDQPIRLDDARRGIRRPA
ncbi:MAG: HAMP domain-containing histidine kinase [Rhizobiaceae bacterium]|nr:HAMP domain-containing histidine kinase [Rhizobiaceae bacterium]